MDHAQLQLREPDAHTATHDGVEQVAASVRAGDPGRARSLTASVATAARNRGDTTALARVALAAAGDGWSSGLDPDSSVLGLLDEALAALAPAPTHLRAELLARSAIAGSHSRSSDLVGDQCEEALAIARMLDDPATTAVALTARLATDTDPLHHGETTRTAEGLHRLGVAHDERAWVGWALESLARNAALTGDLDRAASTFAALEDLGLAGDVVAAHQAAFGAMLRPTLEGDLAEAEAVAARVRDAGERALVDPTAAAAGRWGTVGLLRLLHGRWDDPGDVLVGAFPRRSMAVALVAVIAAGRAGAGDLAGARQVAESVAPAELAVLERDLYWTTTVAMFAAACALLGDRDRACALYRAARPAAGLCAINPSCVFLGVMDHHLGVLAATAGEPALAAEHLERALAAHRRLGSVPWAERSEGELAALRGPAADGAAVGYQVGSAAPP